MEIEWFMIALVGISFAVFVASCFLLQQSVKILRESKRLNTEARVLCRKTESLLHGTKVGPFQKWLRRVGLKR